MNCLDDFNLLPFLTQETDGERYRVENSTLSFGFVGLNEMLLHHCGVGIDDDDARKLGIKVLEFMNQRANELKGKLAIDGLCRLLRIYFYRFATLDREKFGDTTITQGDEQASYYTNSNHVPVNSDVSFAEKIRIEEKFHPLTLGGHIFHAFMGESHSDPQSLMSLTDKIARKSDIGFWAYSSASLLH